MKFANPITAIVTILCCLLLAITARGQYYPAGLGNANLVIWLNAGKSSSITKNGANQVSQWADLSGNNYNFVQATAANKPIYGAASGPYNRPALTFTSTSSQFLSIPNLPASISFTAGISSFVAGRFNAPQTAQGWQRFFDFGNGQASNNIMMGRYGSSANLYHESWKGAAGDQTWTTSNPIVNGFDTVYEVVQQGGPTGTLSTVAHYLAGSSQANNGSVGSSKTWVPASIARTSNYIGRSNWAADNYFSGTLSEILLYNTAFNTSQRTILENYYSAEWGEAISTRKYIPPTSTTYTTNLVGIGFTSAVDNFPSNPAGSTDGLGFSSGTGATDFLSVAGYLMAAHNGQNNTILTNVAIGGIGTTVDCWNRSWYLQRSGGNGSGNVTLNFNFANYNGSVLPGVSNYFLVWNANDGSFATGTNQVVAVNTAAAGSTVSFTVKALSLASGYYTIVWLPSAGLISPASSALCGGNNTSFSVSAINGFSYQWQVNTGSGFGNVPATDPGGAVYGGASSVTLTITGTTSSMNGYTYQLILSPPNGPAITEGPATLVVKSTPTGQALAASAGTICMGSSTTLSIAASVVGVTYNIYSDAGLTVLVGSVSSAANSLVVSPAVTTTYYEQAVQTATGCVQTAAAQSISVTVIANPVLTTSANLILCAGLSDTLLASAPNAQIGWLGYGPGDSLIVSPATTTTYTVVAENAAGCRDTASVTVQVINFKLSLTANPDPIVAGFPVSLATSSAMSYQVLSWTPSGQFPNQMAMSQAFTISDTSHAFSVIAQSANGCLDTASVTVVVQPNTADFFIPNAFTPNGDGKNDVFKVYGSSIREIDLKIFNQWGQLVFESQDAQRGWDGVFSGHVQPAGVYLYGVRVALYGQPATIFRKGSLNLIR